MSPDPILTRELDSLFDAEPPLRATPEQVLHAARAARRHRQRIAVAGSAIGTVVLVGATAVVAAGLSGGPTPNRTADGTGGVTPTANCTVRTVSPSAGPPTPLPSVVPPRVSPTVGSTPTRAPLPADRPYASTTAQPTDTPAPPVARTPMPPPAASPTVPYLTVAPSGRVSGAERMPTVVPDETPVPLPSVEPSRPGAPATPPCAAVPRPR